MWLWLRTVECYSEYIDTKFICNIHDFLGIFGGLHLATRKRKTFWLAETFNNLDAIHLLLVSINYQVFRHWRLQTWDYQTFQLRFLFIHWCGHSIQVRSCLYQSILTTSCLPVRFTGTEGPCLMQLLGLGKSRNSQISH